MRASERKLLKALLWEISEACSIVSPTISFCPSKVMAEKKPAEILSCLSGHMSTMQLYLRYMRFDHEASVRDLENLLGIINKELGSSG